MWGMPYRWASAARSASKVLSIEPVSITSLQITKSVNLETDADPDKKGADTMGMKHRVDSGTYVAYGAINVQLAEKTGFSEEDAERIKEALRTLFVNDETSARPARQHGGRQAFLVEA